MVHLPEGPELPPESGWGHAASIWPDVAADGAFGATGFSFPCCWFDSPSTVSWASSPTGRPSWRAARSEGPASAGASCVSPAETSARLSFGSTASRRWDSSPGPPVRCALPGEPGACELSSSRRRPDARVASGCPGALVARVRSASAARVDPCQPRRDTLTRSKTAAKGSPFRPEAGASRAYRAACVAAFAASTWDISLTWRRRSDHPRRSPFCRPCHESGSGSSRSRPIPIPFCTRPRSS